MMSVSIRIAYYYKCKE
uniref:Uncharacterized protein n=1 Tax=Rhizophora mucronata TaxID=61149 RepID=A0A2P2MNA1_RHIMU